MDLKGVFRGRRSRTTAPEKCLVGSADLACRNFTAFRPNQPQVAALQRPCLCSIYNRCICQVHCRLPCPRSLKADPAFDAPRGTKGLIHSSVQASTGLGYLSIRYTERLSEAGIKHVLGSVGDPYDICWLKSVIGLYKAEVISRRKSWHDLRDIEFATLEWVDHLIT